MKWINQVMTPIASSVSHVALLLKQVSMFPDPWYSAIDWTQIFLYPLNKGH